MKSTLTSLLITAAGLTLSAAAYGQSNLTANVPFSFRTAAGVQPAGEYSIDTISTTANVMRLRNMETGKSSIVGMGAPYSHPNDRTPRMVFLCGYEGCVLSEVKLDDGRGWTYKAPHVKPSENERVAVVFFESRQAE